MLPGSPPSSPTLLGRLWAQVPRGGSLPERVWRSRHRFLVGLTFFHVAAIALAGTVLGKGWAHGPAQAAVVALFGALACWRRAGRSLRSTFAGLGLMSASATLVHLSGGYIEAHFHFFVMLTFLALSQDWIPYGVAVAFVAVHHGVVGVLWPEAVYNHPAAYQAPWTWAGVHALFVLWSCLGSVVAWRFNERAFAQTTLILQAAGEGIFGLDTAGRVTFMNPAAAAMLGVDVRGAVGQPVGEIVRHRAADDRPLPEAESALLAPLRDGAAHRARDQVFGRHDGSAMPVDYATTPMREGGELTGVVVSFNDITERQRSDAALQRSHRELEDTLAQLTATQRQVLQHERLRAMGQMASGIAHDFNNTLSPIVGFAELLLRHPELPPETARGYVQLISTAAHDAAAVIRRLRDLYRDPGETGGDEPVDLRVCVEEVVALTQPRWRNQALGQGIEIHVETDVAGAPVVRGDAAAIREMLANLVLNAVDALPDGGTISLRARRQGDEAVLEVQDTGVGMSEEVRRRCLEPFFSTKGQHGTGLGLTLVHATIERHGGSLRVDSEPGRGSTFVVRLPVQPEAGAGPGAAADHAASRPLRVLVVEDDPLVRRSVVAQLGSLGHTVDSAANGAEGLAKFSAGRFDLVVTDRAMPEMGGDQLAASIASAAPGTPVIMLTGFGDLMAARREQPPGVDAVVGKPVTLDTLAQAIRTVTTARR